MISQQEENRQCYNFLDRDNFPTDLVVQIYKKLNLTDLSVVSLLNKHSLRVTRDLSVRRSAVFNSAIEESKYSLLNHFFQKPVLTINAVDFILPILQSIAQDKQGCSDFFLQNIPGSEATYFQRLIPNILRHSSKVQFKQLLDCLLDNRLFLCVKDIVKEVTRPTNLEATLPEHVAITLKSLYLNEALAPQNKKLREFLYENLLMLGSQVTAFEAIAEVILLHVSPREFVRWCFKINELSQKDESFMSAFTNADYFFISRHYEQGKIGPLSSLFMSATAGSISISYNAMFSYCSDVVPSHNFLPRRHRLQLWWEVLVNDKYRREVFGEDKKEFQGLFGQLCDDISSTHDGEANDLIQLVVDRDLDATVAVYMLKKMIEQQNVRAVQYLLTDVTLSDMQRRRIQEHTYLYNVLIKLEYDGEDVEEKDAFLTRQREILEALLSFGCIVDQRAKDMRSSFDNEHPVELAINIRASNLLPHLLPKIKKLYELEAKWSYETSVLNMAIVTLDPILIQQVIAECAKRDAEWHRAPAVKDAICCITRQTKQLENMSHMRLMVLRLLVDAGLPITELHLISALTDKEALELYINYDPDLLSKPLCKTMWDSEINQDHPEMAFPVKGCTHMLSCSLAMYLVATELMKADGVSDDIIKGAGKALLDVFELLWAQSEHSLPSAVCQVAGLLGEDRLTYLGTHLGKQSKGCYDISKKALADDLEFLLKNDGSDEAEFVLNHSNYIDLNEEQRAGIKNCLPNFFPDAYGVGHLKSTKSLTNS